MSHHLLLVDTIRRFWGVIRRQGRYRQLTIIGLGILTVLAILYGVVNLFTQSPDNSESNTSSTLTQPQLPDKQTPVPTKEQEVLEIRNELELIQTRLDNMLYQLAIMELASQLNKEANTSTDPVTKEWLQTLVNDAKNYLDGKPSKLMSGELTYEKVAAKFK